MRELGEGQVEVAVQLTFPGSERLNYNLTVLLVEGGRNTVVSVETGVIQNYMEGESWPITVPNLMVGETYRFMMAVANEFGPAVGPVPSADFTLAGQWVGTWAEIADQLVYIRGTGSLLLKQASGLRGRIADALYCIM